MLQSKSSRTPSLQFIDGVFIHFRGSVSKTSSQHVPFLLHRLTPLLHCIVLRHLLCRFIVPGNENFLARIPNATPLSKVKMTTPLPSTRFCTVPRGLPWPLVSAVTSSIRTKACSCLLAVAERFVRSTMLRCCSANSVLRMATSRP